MIIYETILKRRTWNELYVSKLQYEKVDEIPGQRSVCHIIIK